MAHTRHGHHIPGTRDWGNPPLSVARCGGPSLCPQCSRDCVQFQYKDPRPIYEEVMGEETMDQADAPKDIGLEARLIVREMSRDLEVPAPKLHDLFVVWSCKTLQNWKALVGRTDNTYYYEVTYNGDKREAYVDVYEKVTNVVVSD